MPKQIIIKPYTYHLLHIHYGPVLTTTSNSGFFLLCEEYYLIIGACPLISSYFKLDIVLVKERYEHVTNGVSRCICPYKLVSFVVSHVCKVRHKDPKCLCS